jgi:hypothetical protein
MCPGDSALVSAYESEVDEEEEEGAGVDLLSAVRVADGPLFSFSADLEAALMGLTIQVRSCSSHCPAVPRADPGCPTTRAGPTALCSNWNSVRGNYLPHSTHSSQDLPPRFCVCLANKSTCPFPPTVFHLIKRLQRAEVAQRGPIQLLFNPCLQHQNRGGEKTVVLNFFVSVIS